MYPIPANATRIRYLESTGTQYIDADVSVALRTTDVSFSAGVLFTQNGRMLIGANASPFVGRSASGTLDSTSTAISLNTWYDLEVRHDHSTGTYGWRSLYVDGTFVYGQEFQTERTSIPQKFAIFNIFFADNSSIASYWMKGRVSWAKISVDGTIVRSFVPCRVGQVGYLFDRVSGTLFGNAGTGDFVLGPDTFSQGVVPTRMMAMGVRKSSPSSLDYVQDSAFLFFDGIENAGRGTHTTTPGTWTNLTGGPNAVGVYSCNASWTADSLSFTETGNYRADLSSVTWPSGGITFEVVFRQNQYGTWAGRIIQTRDEQFKRIDVLARIRTYAADVGKVIVYGTGVEYPVSLTAGQPPVAQTFAIVGSTTTTGFKFRYAGQNENKSTSYGLSQKPPDVTIGGNYNNTRNFLGEVCAVRVHSRALTDNEIDFNAALDRQRFGVT